MSIEFRISKYSVIINLVILLEALARCFLPAIRKFYETEENIKAFKKWDAERTQLRKHDPGE